MAPKVNHFLTKIFIFFWLTSNPKYAIIKTATLPMG